MITVIAARSKNNAIGRNGQIPWHLPEDLARFKRETLGGALIMGRRTWESLPRAPLPDRMNIVVTSQSPKGCTVARSARRALIMAKAMGYLRIYAIGGEGIYRDLLPYAQRLVLTDVDLEVPDADAFFPEFDVTQWAEVMTEDLGPRSQNALLREMIRKTTVKAAS